MPDRLFFALVALSAAAMVALAMVWPQGFGRRSPGRFGHQTPAEAAARMPRLRPALPPSRAKVLVSR